MLRFYLNRELSNLLGIPLSRWKRWSREFLPPDPLGGLQSGFARQYSIQDAFSVYFAGFLVSALGFSIPEARQVLFDLNNWIKKEIIESHGNGAAESAEGQGCLQIDLNITPTQCKGSPAFCYRIRYLMERQSLSDGDALLWQEKFKENTFHKPGKLADSGPYPICSRWVDVSALANIFFRRLSV